MKPHLNTIMIIAGIIIAALIIGNSWKSAHTDKGTIDVSGMAKQDIVSDQIIWQGYISAEAEVTKAAYEELKKDTGIFVKYILSKGINENEITFSPIVVSPDYDYNYSYDKRGNAIKKLKGYILTQDIKIESKDVEKVESASREVSELIDSGVYFVEEATEYYYTKLDTLKTKMIAMATEEAHNRALTISSNSDSKIGDLKHSEMSSFDVTAKNSSEQYTEASTDIYYNNETFNTSSKNKTAVVTVKILC
jgi:uncharacterized protein